MIKLRCKYCEKQVRIKALFGTLHICLTPDEISIKKQESGKYINKKHIKSDRLKFMQTLINKSHTIESQGE